MCFALFDLFQIYALVFPECNETSKDALRKAMNFFEFDRCHSNNDCHCKLEDAHMKTTIRVKSEGLPRGIHQLPIKMMKHKLRDVRQVKQEKQN